MFAICPVCVRQHHPHNFSFHTLTCVTHPSPPSVCLGVVVGLAVCSLFVPALVCYPIPFSFCRLSSLSARRRTCKGGSCTWLHGGLLAGSTHTPTDRQAGSWHAATCCQGGCLNIVMVLACMSNVVVVSCWCRGRSRCCGVVVVVRRGVHAAPLLPRSSTRGMLCRSVHWVHVHVAGAWTQHCPNVADV